MIIAAKCIVRDDKGCALVLRRSKTHPDAPFGYDLPGGKVEHDENIAEGLIRELKEEAGLNANPCSLKLIANEQLYAHYGYDYDLYLYELSLTQRPLITLSFEHDRFEWRPLSDLNVRENPTYMKMIGEYVAANGD